MDRQDLGPEPLRLLLHLLHQLGAEDAVGEARIVLDVGREHQLAAGVEPLEDERREVGAGGVQGGRVAGRPRPDHDHVPHVRHGAQSSHRRKRPPIPGGSDEVAATLREGRGYSCAKEEERMRQSSVAKTQMMAVSAGCPAPGPSVKTAR